ncbi:hypothetical protein LTR37_020250 [Vermiconidia calcicola]|uniref:Uncharacterized protein n=1 Tax=Vermiconidia calcicola TaxID=1690605 RepID=A0ACC3MC19_9PEZI|nr:hypothetical protein LTR37_020250 [Vermiconidia calcicola]
MNEDESGMANSGIYDSDLEEINSIYNDADSDEESLNDTDSPADGYFEPRDRPQEQHVENPALRTSPAEDKTREAEEDRATDSASRALARPPSQPPALAGAPAPLLDAGPAFQPPPNYEAATAHRREEQLAQRQAAGNSRTISYGNIHPVSTQAQDSSDADDSGWSFGSREESEAFGSDHILVRNGLFGGQGSPGQRREPQSMGDTPPPPAAIRSESARRGSHVHADEETGLVTGQQLDHGKNRRRRRWCFGKRMSCMTWCFVIGLIVLVIVLSDTTMDEHGTHPDDGRSETPLAPLPSHPRSHQCSFDSYSDTVSISFDVSKDFSFLELISSSDYQGLPPNGAKLTGTIQVSPAPEDQEEDVRVRMNVATTKPWLVEKVNYVQHEDSLELVFPSVNWDLGPHDWSTNDFEGFCMDMAVIIEVRKGVVLDKWQISTTNMDVVVEDGLFAFTSSEERRRSSASAWLQIRNETSLWAMHGDIRSHYWSSPQTEVGTLSGDITGLYALHDALSFKTESGSLSVGVDPIETGEKTSLQPELRAMSVSGTIGIEFPDSHGEGDTPARGYITRIQTQSADISGRYLLGSSTSISTVSGDIDVFVLPNAAHLHQPTLRTESVSGRTSLNLLEAVTAELFETGISRHVSRPDMGSLISVHQSNSGNIHLIYPWHWAGMIESTSVSGEIDLNGEEVEVLTDIKVPGHRKLFATNGIGGSKLSTKTNSGDMRADIEDRP